MVPPFEMSVFADPGGSFTTAAAMVACIERVLKRWHRARPQGASRVGVRCGRRRRLLVGRHRCQRRREGAYCGPRLVEPLVALAEFAQQRFGATLEPVA